MTTEVHRLTVVEEQTQSKLALAARPLGRSRTRC